ncbi:MAG: acyloxyacyl hydrolase [Terracidiphilus sp.]
MHFLAGKVRLNCCSILAALCVLAPQAAHSQGAETLVETKTSAETNTLAEMKTPAETPSPAGASAAPGPENRAANWFNRPESELIVEGEGSFGHYHIFAYSWWSELYTGGVEYDRHSWNYFLKSEMDWASEVLPVTILVQPAKTDVFGDPLTTAKTVNPGLGIYPIGLRMKWRHDKAFQPYFIIKGGLLIFEKKALSSDAAYQNFSLQIGIGMQRRLTKRLDVRFGYSDIHFSDGFVVPSNPGLDVMSYNGGLVYHLGK